MNRSQVGVLLVAIALAITTTIYRPYYVDGFIGGTAYRLAENRPEDGVFEPGRLWFEFFAIGLFACASLFAAREGAGGLDRFVLRSVLVTHALLLYYFIPQLDGIGADFFMFCGSLFVSIAALVTLSISALTRTPESSARPLHLRPPRESINE